MILYDNGIIKLDYNPATDILEVAYPDLVGYMLPEIKNSIDTLVDFLISYDVKRMLLDSSRTTIAVSQEESREITVYLVAGLTKTRMQKLARLQSESVAVENTASNNVSHIKQQGLLPFPLENFNNKAEAVEWLIG
ncbi:hypothetical protein [Rufibacter roseus]|uniref:STAS/SEC14 domain-containing protein n=1 Tax=Rufibacter roseus TaxID=1567108 RepID=A0ABW2DJ51_9BACT|nr:hypothetical protein [Rufibacter roseus]